MLLGKLKCVYCWGARGIAKGTALLQRDSAAGVTAEGAIGTVLLGKLKRVLCWGAGGLPEGQCSYKGTVLPSEGIVLCTLGGDSALRPRRGQCSARSSVLCALSTIRDSA